MVGLYPFYPVTLFKARRHLCNTLFVQVLLELLSTLFFKISYVIPAEKDMTRLCSLHILDDTIFFIWDEKIGFKRRHILSILLAVSGIIDVLTIAELHWLLHFFEILLVSPLDIELTIRLD